MSRIAYPAELEAHWLAVARAETRGNTDRDALRRLLPDIHRLSERFRAAEPETAPRALYLRDTRDCTAYALFFGPQTYARQRLILSACPPLPDPGRPLRILDLGSGTGAAAWATLDAIGRHAALLHAVDQSRAALRGLKQTFCALQPSRWPQAELRTQCSALDQWTPPADPYDVILLHYVLNELPPEPQRALLTMAARHLAPDGLLLIGEPLRRERGDYLRDLRAFALQDLHLHLWAPCPHSGPCPLGEICHCVRTWKPPPSLQFLNTFLRRDLRHLAFSYLILSPAPLPPGKGIAARVVGSPSWAKGQTLVPACLPDGRIHRLQILQRHLDPAARRNLRRLERGEALLVATLRPLPDSSLDRASLATPG